MKPMILFATFAAVALAQTERAPADQAAQSAALAAKAARTAKMVKQVAEQPRDSDAAPSAGAPVLLTQVSQEPVKFTLTPGDCELVKYPLTAVGLGQNTISLVRNPNGGFNYTMVSDVSGTATDSKGLHYIFLYKQTDYINGGKGVPSPNPPYSFVGPDSFQLIPLDGGVGYTVNIYFNAKIGADGSFIDVGSVANANPNCDPI